ncbi:Lanthionine synthetase C-like protein [Pelomyxa schiedti]|nr:Lanthionine synthetase C-like protein [Pelomyxa schiedti]
MAGRLFWAWVGLVSIVVFAGGVVAYNDTEVDLTIKRAFSWIYDHANSDGSFPSYLTGQDSYDVYSGSAGVAIFCLEYSKYDLESASKALNLAERVGGLLVNVYDSISSGLDPYFFHWGKTGLAFTLHHLFFEFPDRTDFHSKAKQIDQEVLQYFVTNLVTQNGVRRGAAGVGFYYMWLIENEVYSDDIDMESQVRASLNIVAQGILSNGVKVGDDKMRWPFSGNTGYEYPNYSYGTSGIIHFFSKLYTFSCNTTWLDVVYDGARYLLSIADTTDGCLIQYSIPSDPIVKWYFGECNGNSGLIKSMSHVWKVSNDSQWLDLAVSSAQSLLTWTIPEFNFWEPQKSSQDYFWDNLSVCDGNMAAIEALQILAQYNPENAVTWKQAVTDYVDNAMSRKTDTGTWAYWSEAEWRNDPNTKTTQVGMYIGAAGIAHTMMFLSHPEMRIALPDYTYPPFE